jgi:hypothetical protein
MALSKRSQRRHGEASEAIHLSAIDRKSGERRIGGNVDGFASLAMTAFWKPLYPRPSENMCRSISKP